MSAKDNLQKMGISLPTPPAPVANYVPFVQTGNLLSISGQIPMGPNGPEYVGKVGADISMEEAQKAARLSAINIMAQIKAALDGDLDRLVRIVKLCGFVNCVDGFGKEPTVINAASDLMVDVFGDKGRHSRSAVGVASLPLNVCVEIEALAEISPT